MDRSEIIVVQDTVKIPKKVKKPGFLKRLFHHSDSAKLTRKYVHRKHKELRKKLPATMSVDSLNPANSYFQTAKDFQLGYEVFGWYPYWESNYYQHLNYDLLTTIAYFSYEVNPDTGDPTSVHDWNTTALLDSVQNHAGKNILLTVTNFGNSNNRKLLKNPKAVTKLIQNLVNLVGQRKANGVCIDFEGVNEKERANYTSFLNLLYNNLKKANSDNLLYLAIPSVYYDNSLDIKALVPVIDRFVIMGYDYYGDFSTVAGPNAPLASGKTWEPDNLETSVDFYLKNGIPAGKLILALPLYGGLWETENESLPSKSKKYVSTVTYGYVKAALEDKGVTMMDSVSKSAYIPYGSGNQYMQAWYESDSSFVYKSALIKQKKLAGIGLWALGYEKGYNDVWQTIGAEFSQQVKDSLANATTGGSGGSEGGLVHKANTVEKKLAAVTSYKYILLYTMMFVLFFGSVGFVIALFSPNTRAGFFSNKYLKMYFLMCLVLLLMVVLKLLKWIDGIGVALFVGFVAGVLGNFVATLIVERKKRDLP